MIAIRTSGTRERFSRRALLKSMGVSAAFLPLVHSERAEGATAGGFVKRLVTISWTNGLPLTSFWPASDTDPTGTEVLRPLAPLASKVLVVAGIDLKVMMDAGRTYSGHFSEPSLWTGTCKPTTSPNGQAAGGATGPSLDQAYSDFVAKQVNLPVPVMSLALLPIVVPYAEHTSRRNDGNANTPESDPARLFARLFAGGNLSAGQIMALQARRRSTLDFLQHDLTGFGARLGADDRSAVDGHMDAVRQLELQNSATAAKSCQAAAPGGATDYPGKLKALLDLTALAIRCDLTRSVAMVLGMPGNFPSLGVTTDYHGLAHQGPGGYAQKIKIDSWYFSQVAYLAQQLDAVKELGGTALDHTVIGVTNDMNEGAQHYNSRLPYVLIGSAGGYFKTGRVVKVGTWAGKTGDYWNGNSGAANNRLLTTIANALDMPIGSFGSGYPGALAELRA